MLSLTTKFGGFFAAAALALGLAGAASAATVTFSARPATSTPMFATSSGGGIIENDANDIAGVRKGPWAGLNTNNVYTSLGKDGVVSFAEYSLGGVFDVLTFVWGTPDQSNKVEFYRNNVLIDTVLGNVVSVAFPGFGQGANIPNSKTVITAIGDLMGFDTVRFVAPIRTFEYASVVATTTIPVPAAGLLLLTAVGGVAALRRRKSA